MIKKYTLEELNIEFSKFDPTDWEAISTVEFLNYLKEQQAKEVKEILGKINELEDPNEGDPDSEADQMGAYL